jgi:hypothetical protein
MTTAAGSSFMFHYRLWWQEMTSVDANTDRHGAEQVRQEETKQDAGQTSGGKDTTSWERRGMAVTTDGSRRT